VAGKGALTGEVVGVVETDGIDGKKSAQVKKGVPSSASKLHMST
jgi:hypothetical protein